MRNIAKLAVLAGLAMLYRKHKNKSMGHERNESRGLWRKTPPNPDSYDKYGDMR